MEHQRALLDLLRSSRKSRHSSLAHGRSRPGRDRCRASQATLASVITARAATASTVQARPASPTDAGRSRRPATAGAHVTNSAFGQGLSLLRGQLATGRLAPDISPYNSPPCPATPASCEALHRIPRQRSLTVTFGRSTSEVDLPNVTVNDQTCLRRSDALRTQITRSRRRCGMRRAPPSQADTHRRQERFRSTLRQDLDGDGHQAVNDDRGFDLGEHIVLEDLEDSPVPLWEIGWAEASSRQRVAEVCGPGLVSLEARGFVEVRHFERWPEPWEDGRPVVGDELVVESRRVERWFGNGVRTHLVVRITEAGERYL